MIYPIRKNNEEIKSYRWKSWSIYIEFLMMFLQFKISVGFKKWWILVHPFFDSVDFIREIDQMDSKKLF